MPRINSRKKGARGEKIACELLKEWTGDKFHRVPASGGLHWKNTFTAGDVVSENDLVRFDFSVEVKNYDEINFEHLLLAPKVQSEILKFWSQCGKDAQRGKKIPLLLMRMSGMPHDTFFAVIRYKHFKRLKPHLNHKDLRYFKYMHLIFMNSKMLLTSRYKTIKKITTKIIQKEYGTGNR